MGHGYQTVAPRMSRGAIPTLYDPLKPMPARLDRVVEDGDEEKGFADRGAAMGQRDSDERGRTVGDGEISGPLGLQRPEEVVKLRPARPWSAYTKKD